MQLIETIDGRRVPTLTGHMDAALFHALALEHGLLAHTSLHCIACHLARDLDASLAAILGCYAARLDLPHDHPTDLSLELSAED